MTPSLIDPINIDSHSAYYSFIFFPSMIRSCDVSSYPIGWWRVGLIGSCNLIGCFCSWLKLGIADIWNYLPADLQRNTHTACELIVRDILELQEDETLCLKSWIKITNPLLFPLNNTMGSRRAPSLAAHGPAYNDWKFHYIPFQSSREH